MATLGVGLLCASCAGSDDGKPAASAESEPSSRAPRPAHPAGELDEENAQPGDTESGSDDPREPEPTSAAPDSAAATPDGQGSADQPATPDDSAPDCSAPVSAAAELRRLSDVQYRNAVEVIFRDRVTPSLQYPAPSGSTATGYSSELGHEAMSEQDVERAAMAAEDVATQVALVVNDLLPCADDADRACAGSFIDDYGARAYRRPLSDEERGLLLGTFDDARADDFSFEEAIAVIAAHLMQAPQFLYIAEDAASEARALSGYELAQRLSFLLWDSLPDAELLELAETDSLDATALATQAERMLAAPEADAALARFFREWTQTTTVAPGDKSNELFPEFDDALAASMNESFERLVLGAVRDGSALSELFATSDLWLNPTLAEFLDVAAPTDGWQRVELEGGPRRGLLTHPAWLASNAHSDDTSFVFRGRFVQKRLLCNDLGKPPANAMSTEFELPKDPTARERSLAVRANVDCKACHELMDPIGLAFEPFDAVGRYREADAQGRSFETEGTLVGGSDGAIDFADHVELILALKDDPKTLQCYARQVYRFVTAHEEESQEECTVQAMHEALLAADGRLDAALLSLVTSSAFRTKEDR